MYTFLRRPSWIVLAVVVVGVTVLFVRLGVWQVDRLAERRIENAVIASRLEEGSVPLGDLVTGDEGYVGAAAEFAFRRVTAEGSFVPADEVLVRSQTLRGEAGFHVLTPLMIETGAVIVVNRGWVPLSEETPPVSQRPPVGRTSVELVLQATQTRGTIGPTDAPDGRLLQVSRVDIARLAEQIDSPVLSVYGLLVDESVDLPRPVELPELNEGNHLSYAIQWFAFAAISLGGFAALVRSTARRRHPSPVSRERDMLNA